MRLSAPCHLNQSVDRPSKPEAEREAVPPDGRPIAPCNLPAKQNRHALWPLRAGRGGVLVPLPPREPRASGGTPCSRVQLAFGQRLRRATQLHAIQFSRAARHGHPTREQALPDAQRGARLVPRGCGPLAAIGRNVLVCGHPAICVVERCNEDGHCHLSRDRSAPAGELRWIQQQGAKCN